MFFRQFWLATVSGIVLSVAESGLARFSDYDYHRAQLSLAKLRQTSRSFEMEGVDDTQSTIDNTAVFVAVRIRVDLSLRLLLLAAFSDFGVDLGGTDGGGTTV